MPVSSNTVRDLCYMILRTANIYGLEDGDPPAPDTFQTMLILNGMLDSWQIDRMNVYNVQITILDPVLDGSQSYTIGEDGSPYFEVPRPLRIETANILIDGSPTTRYPLQIIDYEQWLSITTRDIGPTIPTVLYYSSDYPNGTINLWNKPEEGQALEIQYLKQLTQFDTLDDIVTFPPGYWDALVYSGAERVAQQWGNTKALPEISRMARDARSRIQSTNLEPAPTLVADSGVQQVRGLPGVFNAKNPWQWYR